MITDIYQDDYIYAGYKRGNSKYLLITFSPLNGPGGNHKIWGESLAKSGVSILGFSGRNRSWYPEKNMLSAISKALDVLSNYEHRICYGTSAGAYAALKFSNSLSADTVLAFSPQYTIDPLIVSTEIDNRFSRFFKKGVTGGSQILSKDIHKKCYLFYDKYLKEDSYHANKIASLSDSIKLINTPFCGHFPILTVSSSDKIIELIDCAIPQRDQDIVFLISKYRKISNIRIKGIIEYILKSSSRREKLALNIFETYKEKLNNNDIASLYLLLGRSFIALNELSLALTCFVGGVKHTPENSHIHRELALTHLKLNDLESSESEIYQSLALDTKCSHTWNALASIMLREKRYHSACDALTKAIDLYQHSDFYRRLCSVYEILNDPENLLKISSQGVEKFNDVQFYHFLYKARLMLSNQSEAIKVINLGLEIYPNDVFLNRNKIEIKVG